MKKIKLMLITSLLILIVFCNNVTTHFKCQRIAQVA